MSVTVDYKLQATAYETLEIGVPAAASPIITHDGFSSSGQLSANSTPPVSKMAAFNATLSSGNLTLDLTSLAGTNNTTINATGLRPVLVKITNPAANNEALRINNGASNGYPLFGANFSITLPPGKEIEMVSADANTETNIAAGAKTIDLYAPNTVNETSQFLVVFG